MKKRRPYSIGLNGATLGSPKMEIFLRAAAVAGFDGVEPRLDMLIEARPEDIRTYGLSWFPLNAIEGLCVLPPSILLEQAIKVFALAKKYNITQVIVVPGRGYARESYSAIEILQQLKIIAEKYGISLLYEMLGFPDAAFNTLDAAWEICQVVHVPLVLDTFHLAIARVPLNSIERLPCEAIGLIHVSDALIAGKQAWEVTDVDRVLPGEGGLPLQEILQAIRTTEYNGRVSVEVFHPKYSLLPPEAVAQDAYARTVALLELSGWQK